MSAQSTAHLVMVRPASFYSDPSTAASNAFQEQPSADADHLAPALAEFDAAVELLRSKGVQVTVVPDQTPGDKPNAIFPNNWFSTHADGTVALYAMAAANRREERSLPVIQVLQDQGLEIGDIIDFSYYESEGQFLEGTGSLILDRINRLAYAGLSNRTDAELVRTFGHELGYETFAFETAGPDGQAIYHTNVMMSIGTGYAVVALETVLPDYRAELQDRLGQWGLEVVDISLDQVKAFAGNVIEIANLEGKRFLLMSTTAQESFRSEQIATITKYAEPLPVAVDTIQRLGGGGIRCMVAEVFLPEAD